MTEAQTLRSRAEALAAALPPLLAEAEHLASTVLLGEHGRRRAGQGDEFWQYRPAYAGDEARSIDWRRSARSDVHFVREKEWQAAQSVMIWVDDAASMRFSSSDQHPTKSQLARKLALALAILLIRGGERVGLTSLGTPPRSGKVQLVRLAESLSKDGSDADYGAPEMRGVPAQSRGVFISDFMGNFDAVERALVKSADQGVRGALVQILDPQEEAFPFDGRTIFESMAGSLRHETMKARGLRDRYLDRLATRKDALSRLARTTGWQYYCHHTDHSSQSALLWLYTALERNR